MDLASRDTFWGVLLSTIRHGREFDFVSPLNAPLSSNISRRREIRYLNIPY